MSSDIQLVYSRTIKTVVEALTSTLPHSYLRYAAGASSNDAYVQLRNDFAQTVEKYESQIAAGAGAEITRYLNYYSVEPRGSIDEFKAIYFVGKAISDHLDRDGLVDCAKVNMLSVLWLLDFRHKAGLGMVRDKLSKRIDYLIKNNAVIDHLGKYGMYLLYKCIYTAALDAKNGKPTRDGL